MNLWKKRGFLCIIKYLNNKRINYCNKVQEYVYNILQQSLDYLQLMSIISTFLLLLLPLITINLNPNAIFSLTWLAGHCEYLGDRCNQQKYAQWDHQSFIINGLWPNQKSSRNFGSFNFNHLQSKGLIDQMYNYWPPQLKTGGIQHYLWKSSWQNHGQNYAEILLDIDLRRFTYLSIERRNEAVQQSYFKRTIEFYMALNVRKLPGNSFTRSSLAKQINIPEQSFYPVCLPSGTLREIRICTKITANSFNLRKCSKQQSNCNQKNLILRDWKSEQHLSDELRIPNSVYTSRKQQKVDDILSKIQIETQGFKNMSKISAEHRINLDEIQSIEVDSRIMQLKRLEQEKPQFNDVLNQMDIEQIILEEFEKWMTQDEPYAPKINKDSSITFTRQQMSQRIVEYIFKTAVVVSIFWISLFVLCCCSQMIKKKQNRKVEQTSTEMRIGALSNNKTKQALEQ